MASVGRAPPRAAPEAPGLLDSEGWGRAGGTVLRRGPAPAGARQTPLGRLEAGGGGLGPQERESGRRGRPGGGRRGRPAGGEGREPAALPGPRPERIDVGPPPSLVRPLPVAARSARGARREEWTAAQRGGLCDARRRPSAATYPCPLRRLGDERGRGGGGRGGRRQII